jgi:glycosyltransferase involved in cell wall biosynthesis
MIETMACGTPVIAFRRGSVPEVVEHGVSGFIVDSEAEAVEAVRRIDSLDRVAVRRGVERYAESKRKRPLTAAELARLWSHLREIEAVEGP